ncbi:hypothetical protein CSZ94_07600 [Janthinobacterium sp. ROICE36]|nr:hypothetical protein CSZ94_07600 [Janthinobacterium sp. ROICE36]
MTAGAGRRRQPVEYKPVQAGSPVPQGRLCKRHAAAFDQRHFQPRLAAIAWLDGHVIAGKLELLREIEWQGDRFQ